jgi:hypothetical protein
MEVRALGCWEVRKKKEKACPRKWMLGCWDVRKLGKKKKRRVREDGS